jgi:hypothetical protein
MAITNAQQFKQLVNPPMKGNKRPGYRGDDAYGGGDQVAGGGDQGNVGGNRDAREIGARMSRTQAMARANQRALAALGDPDPEVNVPTPQRQDTITRFSDNFRANLKSNPFSRITPLGTLIKTSLQTNKAQKMMGLPGFDFEQPEDEEGDGQQIPFYLRQLMMARTPSITKKEEEEEKNNFNFRLLAGGGMADRAPYEGGIMDLESARQMYGLGKLVKKVTRTVKKIAKSPIGKAAILGGIAYFGGPLAKEKFAGLTKLQQAMLVGGGLLGVGALSKQEEEEEPFYAGADIADPRFIMANPQRFQNIRTMAEGGSTEKEPVAKKTMPLLDMGGQEMDLRAEGGFVPIGRMEKADDVPARLSKNEFVFTADAVRNAGDGDVDKGAEVMYNMMKNLEAGGDVSEESQGLEGASKMFQTSQRLGEVL